MPFTPSKITSQDATESPLGDQHAETSHHDDGIALHNIANGGAA
jgi:hypothetical protein